MRSVSHGKVQGIDFNENVVCRFYSVERCDAGSYDIKIVKRLKSPQKTLNWLSSFGVNL